MLAGICPLTPLENHLRTLGGQAGYADSFVEHYIMPVLYPTGLTAQHQLVLGLGVIAVNLSTVQFQSAGFVESVVELLGGEAPGAAPLAGLLELELTERMLMDDLGEVKHRLARLKAAGLTITVDDFGTGYSSLGHLKELPIDKIKIDRSFIQDLPGNRDSAAITRAIVQMGASLGLKVVAEGVETAAQRDFLADQGCAGLQGLLIAAPLPQADFEAWARRHAAAAATSSA